MTSIHSSQSLGPFRVTEIFWDVDMVVLDAISGIIDNLCVGRKDTFKDRNDREKIAIEEAKQRQQGLINVVGITRAHNC
jgi:hypothetical protein